MGDDEEVLIVDLIMFQFTLKHLGSQDFVKLKVSVKNKHTTGCK